MFSFKRASALRGLRNPNDLRSPKQGQFLSTSSLRSEVLNCFV